jgi:hypothetical protein
MPTPVDIGRLVSVVAEKNTVIDAAATLISSLSARLAAASAAAGESQDPVLQASIDALVSDLEMHGSALAKAVLENTPSA